MGGAGEMDGWVEEARKREDRKRRLDRKLEGNKGQRRKRRGRGEQMFTLPSGPSSVWFCQSVCVCECV